MEREHLLKLRNELINTQLGELLLKYLHDIATEDAPKPAVNADELKGFLKCIQKIKDIPSKV
jgi:hypothetical protein